MKRYGTRNLITCFLWLTANQRGDSALTLATKEGNASLIKLLENRGSDTNQPIDVRQQLLILTVVDPISSVHIVANRDLIFTVKLTLQSSSKYELGGMSMNATEKIDASSIALIKAVDIKHYDKVRQNYAAETDLVIRYRST
jgi:ankyrin repeat protein